MYWAFKDYLHAKSTFDPKERAGVVFLYWLSHTYRSHLWTILMIVHHMAVRLMYKDDFKSFK